MGVGVLSPELVHAYGVSGPIARASGVDIDLRRDEPYLAYGELGDVVRVATRTAGDSYARFEVLVEQAKISLDIADACIARIADLPAGPVNVRLPKIVKAPEGSTYVWTENPLGLNGYYLVSRGEKTPWRLKLRTASLQQHRRAARAGGRVRRGRPGRDPRLDVLRRRRHRQVVHAADAAAPFGSGSSSSPPGMWQARSSSSAATTSSTPATAAVPACHTRAEPSGVSRSGTNDSAYPP